MARNFYQPDLRCPDVVYLIKKLEGVVVQKGIPQVRYTEKDMAVTDKKNRILCSFKTYQGTERQQNGVTIWEDTAQVSALYRPDVHIRDRIYVPKLNAIFEVVTEPENINLKNKFIVFKVKRVVSNV